MVKRFVTSAAVVLAATAAFAQPPLVDTSKIGPQVGEAVPTITGVDQFGKTLTPGAVYGPKGAMLVFFRSADW